MESVRQERKSVTNRVNRITGRSLAIFIALYIAATVYFIIYV